MTTRTHVTGGTSLPAAPPGHGRSTYLHHGCRCPWCRNAEASYTASRHRLKAYGRWQAYVDAEPARRHVRALNELGLSWRQVAEAAGVDYAVVRNVLTGASGREPSKQIRPETAKRLLAVPLPSAPAPDGRRLIDATAARRRLQALTHEGWPLKTLARRARTHHRILHGLMHGRDTTVDPRTDTAIRRLYGRLWEAGPATAGSRPHDIHTAKTLAAAKGWAPPLAWDDDTIADPQAEPDWTGRCGTTGGYYDHGQLGSPTCPRCREAVRIAAAERKARRRAKQAQQAA